MVFDGDSPNPRIVNISSTKNSATVPLSLGSNVRGYLSYNFPGSSSVINGIKPCKTDTVTSIMQILKRV